MKFNIGCGRRNFGKDWIHVDGKKYDHINSQDIFLKEYQNDIADLIYSSHMIEYFDRNEVIQILKRWKQVLKPNGVMRLAVPDFFSISYLYINKSFPLEKFLGPLYGKMSMNGKNIYHKTVYDFKSIKKILNEIGMKNIKKYNWRNKSHSNFDDHSQAYLPHFDKENGFLISLNIECNK
tara:strand:- start:145 stop:681 length:537 start_codon:yes stop_codon:yes gene_type:complete